MYLPQSKRSSFKGADCMFYSGFIYWMSSLHVSLLGHLMWAPNCRAILLTQRVLLVSRSKSMPWRFWRRTTTIRFQALSTAFLSCKRMIMWARPDTNSCVSLLGFMGRSLLMRQKKKEWSTVYPTMQCSPLDIYTVGAWIATMIFKIVLFHKTAKSKDIFIQKYKYKA